MRLQHIPLADLKVSPLNMRHGRKKPDLTDLLPSIRARGVLVPLIVRPNGSATTFEIVGGRRRYFAAKQVAKEAEADEAKTPLPCHVLDGADDASAVEASLLENTARLDPDPMQQFEAFKRLSDEGRSVPDIAERFGVSELIVNRRLALARLIAPIRAEIAVGKLDLASAQTLTLASDEKQRDWFELYASDERAAPFYRELRAYVLGGGEIETSAALFDLEGYEGGIVTDLFGERSVFADASAFWQAQDEAIDALAEGYRERGWTTVTVLRDRWFDSWRHERAKKAEGGGVFVEVRRTGEVVCHEGYVAKKDERANGAAKIKREMSGPLEDYVALHRHAIVRAGVCSRPEDALRLVIAHAVAGSQLWSVKPEPQETRKADTADSVKHSVSQQAFEAARAEVAPLLARADPEQPLVRGYGDDYAVCEAFEALRGADLPSLLQLLAVVMAESLQSRSCAVEHLASAWALDFEAAWRPDDAFFSLVRDKATLAAMLTECATPAVAKANAGGTAKQLRTVLRDTITGANGRKANPDWRPRWMRRAFGRYDEDAECRIASHAARVAGLAREAS
jgi:ParB family chromosome partitioning protein